jgi:hypothetical protein
MEGRNWKETEDKLRTNGEFVFYNVNRSVLYNRVGQCLLCGVNRVLM